MSHPYITEKEPFVTTGKQLGRQKHIARNTSSKEKRDIVGGGGGMSTDRICHANGKQKRLISMAVRIQRIARLKAT